jgi:lipopolysaccharide/colanic/teichoic acid biosynthesis glycosyltransferase
MPIPSADGSKLPRGTLGTCFASGLSTDNGPFLTNLLLQGYLMLQQANTTIDYVPLVRPTRSNQAAVVTPDNPSIDLTDPSQPSVRHTRIRPLRGQPISLAAEGLAAGESFVQPKGQRSSAYLASKRLFDILAAMTLLVLFSPIMLGTFLVLMVTTRGKPIFRQQRLGHLGRPFLMLKFRTMSLDADRRRHQVVNEKDGPIFKNRRDHRITRIGRFLRSSSIDEMPQLFNVLAGRMSMVGPRPPIGTEVAQYKPWQRDRLAVKPGLTCLWQVSGRSEVAFEPWVRMDLWYIANQSTLADVTMLVKTPWSVLTRRGAY